MQQEVGNIAQTAIEFPPMQPGASFNLEAVKAQLEKARAAHGQYLSVASDVACHGRNAVAQYGCGQRPPTLRVSSSAVCATTGPNCRIRSSGSREDGPASEIAASGSACSS